MRKLTTSLSLLALLAPASAWAQQAATPDETAEDPAEAAAEEEATADEEPTEEADADVESDTSLDAGTTGTADADADVSAGLSAPPPPATPPPPPATADPAPPPPAAAAGDSKTSGPKAATTRSGAADSKWGFAYSGYFRAPLRMGIGTNTSPAHRQDAIELAGSDVNPDGKVLVRDEDGAWIDGKVQKERYSLHLPVIPDNQYPSWQFTSHNRSDWAEMFFSVGNSMVSGTLAIQAFQYTDSTWELSAGQFGIGQGWIEVDHDLGLENFNFNAKVGAHWARYGMAGIYDAGEYDTYLFGRTHTTGVTLRTDFILPTFDLGVEAGFGAKVPNPKQSNRARFTTLAHGHLFFTFPAIEFSLNALHAWSAQEAVPQYNNHYEGSSGCDYPGGGGPGAYGSQCTINDDQYSPPDGTEFAGGPSGIEGDLSAWGPQYPMGSQTVLGADVRWDLGLLGYLYAGYSYQILKNSLTVDSAIEAVHAYGGGNFNIGVTDNYLESPFCKVLQGDPDYITAPNDSCSNGTGNVGTALLQYELGLANFGIFPGNMDLKLKLYGMLNHISVDDIEEERLAALYDESGLYSFEDPAVIKAMRQDGTIKYKFGADAEFFPLDFMSFGLRFDRLNPTNNKYLQSYHGFSILSPRIVFRTQMVTHEEFSIQYSRYFYDQRECVSEVNGIVDGVASPADDPFRVGGQAANPGNSIYGGTHTGTGLPLNLHCTQPPPGPRPPYGFGSHAVSQDAGNRGSPQLLPDENVIKIEASMWW